MTVLDQAYNFASLSVRDLLDARDAYHYHLLCRPNVVGTAIGLYLIRKEEAWPRRRGEGRTPVQKLTYPRTLENSEVRDYSWPCVLAFVREWEDEEAFTKQGRHNPADILPKTLFLSDGRAVPVCVVKVDQVPPDAGDVSGPPAPQDGFGGGLAIEAEVQGELHAATAGCLVSDGHTTYALTARHACGDPGEVISVRLREGPERIGVSTAKQLTRLPFADVYPDFVGRRSYVALDVGLVRLDDVTDWTSNTYGLPPPGPMADVHERNLSLRLIDQPLAGYGAASGLLRGSIKALFYRHRSVGGYDYVGDFLIAPKGDQQTRRGDSGMIWHLDVTKVDPDRPPPLKDLDLRPLAVEWGGQIFDEGGHRSAFAVATSLSNVCKLLDVELVSDRDRGVSGYWGRTGHYSIGRLAIDLVGGGKLKQLLEANASILSFEASEIAKKGFDDSVGQASMADEFVPLADVPDEIWKKVTREMGGKFGRTGGRDFGAPKQSNGPEHPQHYADIDAPFGPAGETLRDLCLADPDTHLTVDAWLAYYATMSQRAKAAGDKKAATQYASKFKQGLVPFRLWQFYDAMVEFLRAGDVLGYLTAGGIAAHYMGDCSQPLHGSILADGDKSRPGPRSTPGNPVPFGDGIHSVYETMMVSRKAGVLLPDIAAKLAPFGGHHGLALCGSGFEIAKAVIQLMDDTAKALPPQRILDVFEAAGGTKKVATVDTMWTQLRSPTADVMALGARYLALLWQSAWVAGGGEAVAANKIKAYAPGEVRGRYIDPDFLPSLTLDEIKPVLKP